MSDDSRALFLDRDGVINLDIGYLHKEEDCVFVPGVFELVRRARGAGFSRVIVVTNQAGIARGYYSEETFLAFTDWMLERFREEGAPIDRVFYCPHHPDAGTGDYRRKCECRKPAPGMLLEAQRTFGVDMSRSVMVGDTYSDMAAAAAAHVGTRLLLGNGCAQNQGGVRAESHFDVMTLLGI